ncbi:flagellar M-ring protein FliF [Arthrobacter sp. LS16]|nr:flagellar M-ring protein FliF [Arthrobacter sp. LS16]
MPKALVKLGESIRGFTLAQRTIAVIGLAIVVLGTVALVSFASQPKMTPLFTGLSAEDASGIVEQLQADAVPYEITGAGGTILVPQENVYEARLKAATAGLPTAGAGGYSLLDQMGVTASEFQQDVTYKRALEGELASTIMALDSVSMASVKLAIPEQTVFVDSATTPTASIFVQPKPNTTLTADQVQAIVHLTSAAVDGLKPADISVVDSNGTLLSAAGVGVEGSAGKQASEYEQRVGSMIQTMLDRVVGPGNATVAVAADVSLESAERTEESFSAPKDNPVLAEKSKKEDYQGSGSGGGEAGVLGPDNIAVPSGEAKDGTFTSSETDRTNAVNKVTENRLVPSGNLNRQSVSVALDAQAASGLDVQELTAMISAAAGIDTGRKDTINVSVLPFSTESATAAQNALTEASDAAKAARDAELLRTLVIAGSIVLVLVLLAVYLLLRRRNRRSSELVDLGELQDLRSLREPSAAVSVVADTPTTTISQIPATVSTPHVQQLDAQTKREELSALAAQNPAKMAQHLRSLMDSKGDA